VCSSDLLESLHAARVLHPHDLDAAHLADAIASLDAFRPAPLAVDLDGAATSARIVAQLAGISTAVG